MNNIKECSIIYEIRVKTEGEVNLEYLLRHHRAGEEYGVPGMVYSIEIIMDSPAENESVILEDITRDYQEAVDIITEFAKNTVTPDSAIYIAEDMLS